MEISHMQAFLLGSGFHLQVNGYNHTDVSAPKRIALSILSVVFTLATGGLFFVAGPLIGRAIYNKRHPLTKTEQKTQSVSEKLIDPIEKKVAPHAAHSSVSPPHTAAGELDLFAVHAGNFSTLFPVYPEESDDKFTQLKEPGEVFFSKTSTGSKIVYTLYVTYPVPVTVTDGKKTEIQSRITTRALHFTVEDKLFHTTARDGKLKQNSFPNFHSLIQHALTRPLSKNDIPPIRYLSHSQKLYIKSPTDAKFEFQISEK